MDNKQEENAKTTHCQRFYNNGAHAGNIHYRIDAWGMNSPVVEAAIKQHLDEFISRLQVNWQGS